MCTYKKNIKKGEVKANQKLMDFELHEHFVVSKQIDEDYSNDIENQMFYDFLDINH